VKRMKVSELIRILKKYKQDLPVATSGAEGCVDWLYEVQHGDIYICTELIRNYKTGEMQKKKCLVVG